MLERFIPLLAAFIAVTVIITCHEFAHAYAAYKCGDPTAKFSGRMTLNPVKHFDPLGIVMFVVAGFGWAKPVPINPYNFKNYKKGCFWTASAGVLVNYLMAFLFYPLFYVIMIYVYPIFVGTYMAPFLYSLFSALYLYSLGFCVFNLVPLYPLDGFRIIDAVNTKRGKLYYVLRDKGQYILLGLILLHYLSRSMPILGYIDILGYFLSFAENILGKPISLFWDWILGFILK